jgi:hypothetical protein
VSERGTITLWVLGLCVAVLTLGALALDLGRAVSARRAWGAAADAAALAGAGGIDVDRYRRDGTVTLEPALAVARAREAFAREPAAGRAHLGVVVDDGVVRVVVEGQVDLTLLRLVRGGASFTVRASAVARPHLRGPGAPVQGPGAAVQGAVASPRSRSRSTNFWIFPDEVRGRSSATRISSGNF